MTKIFAFPVLALGMAALAHAQTPTKVAIIHVQNAILSTKEGQKAANDLTTKFAPKKAELDKKQADLAGLQDQLRKGSATMSEEMKSKLMRDFDSGNKSLQRDTQDAQDELDQEQGKVMQELGNKIPYLSANNGASPASNPSLCTSSVPSKAPGLLNTLLTMQPSEAWVTSNRVSSNVS